MLQDAKMPSLKDKLAGLASPVPSVDEPAVETPAEVVSKKKVGKKSNKKKQNE